MNERIGQHREVILANNEFDVALESLIRFAFLQGFKHGGRKMAEAAGITWPVDLHAEARYTDWRGYGPGATLIGGSAFRKAHELEEQARKAQGQAPRITAEEFDAAYRRPPRPVRRGPVRDSVVYAGPCQVHGARDYVTCAQEDSHGVRCENQTPDHGDDHWVSAHTIQHYRIGNGYACTALGAGHDDRGAWHSWQDDGGPDEVTVCVTHRRFVPCRSDVGRCAYSTDPEDVVAVRMYQQGSTE